tara:strand:- start:265 stop:1623 length:1359 start_codon:yes stop_codon:yes gene_type:complete
MSYQNPGIPRFYINVLEWLDKIGYSAVPSNHFNTLPVFPSTINTTEISIPYDLPNPYIAILGHNGENFSMTNESDSAMSVNPNGIQVNANTGQFGGLNPELKGWSLFEPAINSMVEVPSKFLFSGDELIGSILVGSYYDMSISPELSLKMDIEYGYTKEITTYNGSSLSNTMAFKPSAWGDLGAWELSDSNDSSLLPSRSGRRIWQLSFSYMQDSDLWGVNQLLTNHMNSFADFESDDFIGENIYVDFTGFTEGVGDNGLDSFTTSSTGFQGNHAYGHASKAGTNADIDVQQGQTYTIEFDLTLASGVSPRISIAYGFLNNNQKLTGNHIIANSSGHYKFDLQANNSHPNGFLMFEHKHDYASTQYTISNTQVYISSGGDAGFNYNTLTDDSFFTQVWQKTLGGSIPFLFQPDNTNNNPDQFAIARIKDNSLKATQSAINLYDISLTIEECW